jgi:hypothetical protein
MMPEDLHRFCTQSGVCTLACNLQAGFFGMQETRPLKHFVLDEEFLYLAEAKQRFSCGFYLLRLPWLTARLALRRTGRNSRRRKIKEPQKGFIHEKDICSFYAIPTNYLLRYLLRSYLCTNVDT